MRRIDVTEQFRDGLEPIPTLTLRWGVVSDVFPEGQTVQSPEGEVVTIGAARTMLVSWLDNPGTRSYVPFVASWGSTSVPPKNATVCIGFTQDERPVVLGFRTSGDAMRIGKGEFGALQAGEEVLYRRAWRLRVLDNYTDASDVRPDEADFEVDLTLGSQEHSVKAVDEPIRARAGIITDSAVALLIRHVQTFVDDVDTAYIDEVTKKALKSDLQVFVERDLYLQMLERVYGFLNVSINGYFVTALTAYVDAGNFDEFDFDVKTEFTEGFEGWLQTEILGWLRNYSPQVEPVFYELWAGRFKTAAQLLQELILSEANLYLRKKFRTYLTSKVSEGMRAGIDVAVNRGWRWLKKNVLSKALARVDLDFPFVDALSDIVESDSVRQLLDLRSTIEEELREGLRDPDTKPLVDWIIRSRRDEDNRGEVRIQIRSDGSVEIESNRGRATISIDVDGDVKVKGASVTIDADEIKLGEDAQKKLAVDGDQAFSTEWFKEYIGKHIHEDPATGVTGSPIMADQITQAMEFLGRGIATVKATGMPVAEQDDGGLLETVAEAIGV